MSRVPFKNVTQSLLQDFFIPTPKTSATGAMKRVLTPNTPAPADGASCSKVPRLDTGDQVANDDPSKDDKNIKHRQSVAQMLLKLPSPCKALIHGLDADWLFHLSNVVQDAKFSLLAEFIEKERKAVTVYPPPDQVFSWSKLTKPKAVRVVILGQDPYHGPNQAHGLAFSVQRPQPPPPSLINMFKEIASDCAEQLASTEPPRQWPPKHGDLTNWANQGVLLLNAVLTVRRGQPNSHKDRGWEQLTNAVVRTLNKEGMNLVFLLWGANAQAQASQIDAKRHLILRAPHPSPLSASRGFFGCRHFSQTNEYLCRHKKAPIDWTNL
ncbi:unnamed protein product [Schistocephalus solidus]|uniref:Uracil-DNA glycosylase n=1 Tax=Schistocephalus solidus TaxID=70667 RepID=A0A183TBC8_SCHSO|nr:unnamed protein product [Schistocephalus solidus]